MIFTHRESEIPAKIKRRSARLAGVFVIEDYFSEPIIRDGRTEVDRKRFKRRWQWGVILILLHFSRGDDSSVLPHHTSPTIHHPHPSLPANHVFSPPSLSLSHALLLRLAAVSEQNFYDNRLKDSKLTSARRADPEIAFRCFIV